MAVFTWFATPIAALTATPKNLFIITLTPWFDSIKTALPIIFQPENSIIPRKRALSVYRLKFITENLDLQYIRKTITQNTDRIVLKAARSNSLSIWIYTKIIVVTNFKIPSTKLVYA